MFDTLDPLSGLRRGQSPQTGRSLPRQGSLWTYFLQPGQAVVRGNSTGKFGWLPHHTCWSCDTLNVTLWSLTPVAHCRCALTLQWFTVRFRTRSRRGCLEKYQTTVVARRWVTHLFIVSLLLTTEEEASSFLKTQRTRSQFMWVVMNAMGAVEESGPALSSLQQTPRWWAAQYVPPSINWMPNYA